MISSIIYFCACAVYLTSAYYYFLINSQVGGIEIDESDDKGCSFTIQVLGRLYHLRAASRVACKDWVITLNRVKEARLQQGNVKLVDYAQPVDLLDAASSQDMVAPRVVVVANRQRTRAVDETVEFERLMVKGDASDPASLTERRRSTIGTVVLARWSKRKSSLQRLGTKLAKWARSVRRYGCAAAADADVQLDRHVHPPGHDDHRRSTKANEAWIRKERQVKPQGIHRGISLGSEDGARYLS